MGKMQELKWKRFKELYEKYMGVEWKLEQYCTKTGLAGS